MGRNGLEGGKEGRKPGPPFLSQPRFQGSEFTLPGKAALLRLRPPPPSASSSHSCEQGCNYSVWISVLRVRTCKTKRNLPSFADPFAPLPTTGGGGV